MVQKAMETEMGKIHHDLAPWPSRFCHTVILFNINSYNKREQ